ncbi:MAG TPA: hypothetical protein VMT12_15255 [Syntrophales bacterium]|nr:hypothetical protein [Syntrophales bacterium]
MDKYDNLEIRCPHLGGEVRFSYCRKEGGELPCLRVITCWYPYFPVEQHLRESMTAASWNSFVLKVPKDKVTTLIELIEEAKRQATHKSE